MRRFKVTTTSSDADLLDLFTFHVPREAVSLQPMTPGYGFHAGAPGAPEEKPAGQGRPGLRLLRRRARAAGRGRPAPPRRPARTAGEARGRRRRPPGATPSREKAAAAPNRATLRVSVEKVDQLINLVGELVITQAMLAQNSKTWTPRCTSRWPAAWPTWSATPATCRKR
jgi:two-component system chemotaxis sensor kinase CheA